MTNAERVKKEGERFQSRRARGKFLILDGLDGVGKGLFLDVMKESALAEGKRVFDLHEYWRAQKQHPVFEEFREADLLLSSEPTFVGEGKRIREELIRADKNYPARVIAEAYARDRQALYEAVLIPALKAGISVVQSRGVTTSLVYQPLDAARKGESLSVEEVAALPGNAFCLRKEWLPDFIVIPTVRDVEVVMRRLARREKQDNATFEQYEFQRAVKEAFESAWFQRFFRGVKVIYIDAETTLEESRETATRLYHQLFTDE